MNAERRKQIADLRAKLEEILPGLENLRDEEREAFDNMPESLQQGERGQAAETAADALDEATTEVESAIQHLDECEGS